MEEEFVYCRQKLPIGIEVDEVYGGAFIKSRKAWELMAKQIVLENSDNDNLQIGHYDDGAPFLYDIEKRISLTHTNHFLAIASLKDTPGIDLSVFDLQTALGIDAENLDREQVLKVAPRFLSQEELKLTDEDQLKTIIAWTAKEAAYKAALTRGLNFKDDITLLTLPKLNHLPLKKDFSTDLGEVLINIKNTTGNKTFISLALYSYESENNCVTLAFNAKPV